VGEGSVEPVPPLAEQAAGEPELNQGGGHREPCGGVVAGLGQTQSHHLAQIRQFTLEAGDPLPLPETDPVQAQSRQSCCPASATRLRWWTRKQLAQVNSSAA
jgi:hypothetical protein